MKKVFSLVALTSIFLMICGLVQAQTKMGHTNLEDVVSIMPDIKKADSILTKFKKDSLESMLPYYLSEFKRKDSIAKAETTPAVVRQQAQQEAGQYGSILQNWDQYSQNELQRKQQEVLQPYFAKAFQLVNEVAKENGYTWVFKQDALLVAPQTDDLLPLIAKKLGVKLPTAPQVDNKQQPTTPGKTPANPTTKPKQ